MGWVVVLPRASGRTRAPCVSQTTLGCAPARGTQMCKGPARALPPCAHCSWLPKLLISPQGRHSPPPTEAPASYPPQGSIQASTEPCVFASKVAPSAPKQGSEKEFSGGPRVHRAQLGEDKIQEPLPTSACVPATGLGGVRKVLEQLQGGWAQPASPSPRCTSLDISPHRWPEHPNPCAPSGSRGQGRPSYVDPLWHPSAINSGGDLHSIVRDAHFEQNLGWALGTRRNQTCPTSVTDKQQ